jgi:hypothetical protein
VLVRNIRGDGNQRHQAQYDEAQRKMRLHFHMTSKRIAIVSYFAPESAALAIIGDGCLVHQSAETPRTRSPTDKCSTDTDPEDGYCITKEGASSRCGPYDRPRAGKRL